MSESTIQTKNLAGSPQVNDTPESEKRLASRRKSSRIFGSLRGSRKKILDDLDIEIKPKSPFSESVPSLNSTITNLEDLKKLMKGKTAQAFLSPGKKIISSVKKASTPSAGASPLLPRKSFTPSTSSSKLGTRTTKTTPSVNKENMFGLAKSRASVVPNAVASNTSTKTSPKKRKGLVVPKLPKLRKRQRSNEHKKVPVGPVRRVFGVPLETIMERQKRKQVQKWQQEHPDIPMDEKDILQIPLFVKNAIDYLRTVSLNEVGIFRISASSEEVLKLKREIDATEGNVSLDKLDCHIVACALKAFFREMPDPLLHGALYDQWLDCVEDESVDIEKIQKLLDSLSFYHKALAKEMFELFHTITQNNEINKMSPSNLATTNGPGLLFRTRSTPVHDSRVPDPLKEIAPLQALIAKMIREFPTLFANMQFNSTSDELDDLRKLASDLTDVDYTEVTVDETTFDCFDDASEIDGADFDDLADDRDVFLEDDNVSLASYVTTTSVESDQTSATAVESKTVSEDVELSDIEDGNIPEWDVLQQAFKLED